MAIILSCWLMTNGSFTYSVGRNSKNGLLSIYSYKRCEPMQKLAMTLPWLMFFLAQVMAPQSTRSIIQSLNISVWTPSSFLSRRNSARACGMRPMPHSIVLPSSTSRAMFCPILRSVSSGSWIGTVMTGSSQGTIMSICPTCRNESPSVRGMQALTWAMTYRALATADFTMSTDTPRLHRPLASGGDTLTSAASMGMRPESNSRGMSDRKIGV